MFRKSCYNSSMHNSPKVSIDILVLNENKILLGLLKPEWSVNNQQVYGVPGRDIFFRETIGECVKRNIKEELDCKVNSYKVISVNANYELGNHYIGIGVLADITGNIKLMKPEDWESWKWFDFDHLPGNLFAAAKNLIESYQKKQITVSE